MQLLQKVRQHVFWNTMHILVYVITPCLLAECVFRVGIPGTPRGPGWPRGPPYPAGPGGPGLPRDPGAAGPGGPGGPTQPLGPVDPTGPVYPDGPMCPVSPVAPVSPGGPGGPVTVWYGNHSFVQPVKRFTIIRLTTCIDTCDRDYYHSLNMSNDDEPVI